MNRDLAQDAVMKSAVPCIARILLALIFVLAGINQLSGTARTAATMTSHGIPFANVLVYGAIIVELGGGLMLMLGWQARWGALGLFFYTMALALIFHPFWAEEAAQRRADYSSFFGHLSMMGGMLYVYVFGAGAWSVDHHLQRGSGSPQHGRRE
jgi:putative oxidoreductase